MSVALILTMLLLPFSNLLNVKAEEVIINVDENKKVVDTTGLIVKVNDDNTDIFKAYKVLDAYYDSSSNVMSYDFTPEFSNFLTTSGDTKLANLTVDDYMAYGNIDSNLSFDKRDSIQKEYNNMIANFAKYIKKGTNTLPKTYELTNNIGVSKTAPVEVGSYLILPAVFSDKPFIIYGQLSAYNYYSALIANAIYQVENEIWTLTDCEVYIKNTETYLSNFIINMPINDISQENFTEDSVATDMELYKNKEYTLCMGISDYDDDNQKIQITLPEGVVLVDNSDLNNVYYIEPTFSYTVQTTSDGKLLSEPDGGSDQRLVANIKTEDVVSETDDGTTVTNKVITIIPTGDYVDVALFGIRIKLNDDKEKLVFGLDGNAIKTDFTFTVDPYTDPVTTKTINLENKALTYGLQISNKSQSDNSYLSGAVFGIYTDANCSDDSKVGELNINETVDDKPVGRYAGLPSGTYYVKQLKVSSGYKPSSTVASVTIDSSNKGYFALEVENDKMGLLPSTGGLGTILYTTFGLLVIVVGSIAYVSYRKKSQVNS